MLKKLPMLMMAGLLAGGLSVASAQNWSLPLEPRNVAQLPPDARADYQEAWELIDRISYDVGVALLNRAASKAPENKGIQFYTASRAMNRANVYYSAGTYRDITDEFFNEDLRRATQPPWLIDEIFIDGTINQYTTPPWKVAEAFLQLVEACTERLDALENLTAEEENRLQRFQREVRDLRANLSVRDQKRQEAARPLVEHIFRQRREVFFASVDPFDPLNPFDVEMQNAIRGIREQEDAEALGIDLVEYNPFALLPGEFIEPTIPPVQFAPAGFGFPGGTQELDEFGRPIGGGGFGMEAQGFDPFGPPGGQAPQGGTAPPSEEFLF